MLKKKTEETNINPIIESLMQLQKDQHTEEKNTVTNYVREGEKTRKNKNIVKTDKRAKNKDALSTSDYYNNVDNETGFSPVKSKILKDAFSTETVHPVSVVPVQGSIFRKMGMCPVCNRVVCSSIDKKCVCGATLLWEDE